MEHQDRYWSLRKTLRILNARNGIVIWRTIRVGKYIIGKETQKKKKLSYASDVDSLDTPIFLGPVSITDDQGGGGGGGDTQAQARQRWQSETLYSTPTGEEISGKYINTYID